MVRRALVPGAIATIASFAIGSLLAGWGAGASAGIGMALAVANFAAHGFTLGWAAGISVNLVHVVAMVGPVIRIGIIVGLLFLLDTQSWFSPVAFALTIVPGTLVLLVLEARLFLAKGVASQMEIPADPVAARAAGQLVIKESR